MANNNPMDNHAVQMTGGATQSQTMKARATGAVSLMRIDQPITRMAGNLSSLSAELTGRELTERQVCHLSATHLETLTRPKRINLMVVNTS